MKLLLHLSRAALVLVCCLILFSSNCWYPERVAKDYQRLPETTLFYQALALNIPQARLRYYEANSDWTVEQKLKFLRHPSLKLNARAHYLIAMALFDAERYQDALKWTYGSRLAHRDDTLLLRAQIFINLDRTEQAQSLLLELKGQVSEALLAQVYLDKGELTKALTLLDGNTSAEGKVLNERLHELLNVHLKSKECRLNIQLLVSDYKGLEYSNALINRWRKDTSIEQLPICFTKVQTFEPESMACIDEKDVRQSCDLTLMAQHLNLAYDTLPVVINGVQGKANYNNGIIFINHLKSYGVFKHELMHHFGFLDEYQLHGELARKVCNVGNAAYVGENLYIVPNWQMKEHGSQQVMDNMVKVATCDSTDSQAYKSVENLTLMEFMDQPLPSEYVDKIKGQLSDSGNRLANYQYAYALAFDRKGDRNAYRYWLEQSAKRGYGVAQSLLRQ